MKPAAIRRLTRWALIAASSYRNPIRPAYAGLDNWTAGENESSGVRYIIGHAGPVCVVAITGTEPEDWRDWLTNARGWLVAWDNGRGRYHKGFLLGYLSVRPQIFDYIASGRFREVEVAGHSAGGAMAQYCAHDLLKHAAHVRHVTGAVFGAPASMDAVAARANYGRLYDVTRHRDLVPYLTRAAGFCATGPFIYIDGKGKLHDKVGECQSCREWYKNPNRGLLSLHAHRVEGYIANLRKNC